jgi:hypothetical protein
MTTIATLPRVPVIPGQLRLFDPDSLPDSPDPAGARRPEEAEEDR